MSSKIECWVGIVKKILQSNFQVHNIKILICTYYDFCKIFILINLTPAEEEKLGKIVGFLLTFGDWTFI